ncbi:MAG: PucR family transcriptional regulator [Eubacterium sp.]|jgi:sugar diacid utilization regulator
MFINLKSIQNLFPAQKTSLTLNTEHICLTCYQFLNCAPTPYSEHILYVTDNPDTLSSFDLIPHMHLLILIPEDGQIKELPEPCLSACCSVLTLVTDDKNASCLTLQNYFDVQCGTGLLAESLLDIQISENSIQRMVEHACQALCNPVVVFDASFNLIASYADLETLKEDKWLQEMLQDRAFSSSSFEMVKKNHIHEKMMSTDTPTVFFNRTLQAEQMMCPISTHRNLGHLVMNAVNHPFHELDRNVFYMLKRSIFEQMQKNEFIRNNKGYTHEYYLRDLLDGKIAALQQQKRMHYLEDSFPGNFICLVVDLARSSTLLDIRHIHNLFDYRLSNSRSLIYGDQIVILLSIGTQSVLSEQTIRQISDLCHTENLYAGMSNTFVHITQLPEYYKQALRALEIGVQKHPVPGLFSYRTFYLQHMLNLFVQKENPNTFCHPAMQTLFAYDQKNHTQLAETLAVWLSRERNASAAAEHMKIHRNTMIYRLNKINELVQADYDDFQERQYLILSYELNRTADKN